MGGLQRQGVRPFANRARLVGDCVKNGLSGYEAEGAQTQACVDVIPRRQVACRRPVTAPSSSGMGAQGAQTGVDVESKRV